MTKREKRLAGFLLIVLPSICYGIYRQRKITSDLVEQAQVANSRLAAAANAIEFDSANGCVETPPGSMSQVARGISMSTIALEKLESRMGPASDKVLELGRAMTKSSDLVVEKMRQCDQARKAAANPAPQ